MNIKIPGKRQFLSQDRLHEEVKASLGPSGTLKKNSFDSLPYLKVSPFNFFWPTSSWQYWFSILWKSYAGSYQRDAKVWFSSVGQCKVMIAMIRSCMAVSGSQFLSDLLWFQNPGARDWCWWPPPPCWHCCGSLSYDHGAQPTGAFILIIRLSNGRSLLRMNTEQMMMYSNANAHNFCLVYQQPWRVSSRKMDQIRKRICKFLRRQTKHDDCIASLFLNCALSWKEDDCVAANESSVFSNQSILLWASPLAKAPACASAKDSLSSKSSFFFPRLSRGSGERSVFCIMPFVCLLHRWSLYLKLANLNSGYRGLTKTWGWRQEHWRVLTLLSGWFLSDLDD